MLFGRHPLAPIVSKAKTWEGFAGSVLFCCIAGVLFLTLTFHEAWWKGLLFGLGIVVTATLGDLGESVIKRDLGVKDMSNLLPGHGGLMDRLDSMLPCAAVGYLLLSAFAPDCPHEIGVGATRRSPPRARCRPAAPGSSASTGTAGRASRPLRPGWPTPLPDAVVVHGDDFASPSVPEWDFARFNAQVVQPLLAGRPARYQRWDWHTDTGAEWHDVPVGVVVVVEGVSSTRREVTAPWDLTIWVEAPEDVRLARALERDGPDLLAPGNSSGSRRRTPTSNASSRSAGST